MVGPLGGAAEGSELHVPKVVDVQVVAVGELAALGYEQHAGFLGQRRGSRSGWCSGARTMATSTQPARTALTWSSKTVRIFASRPTSGRAFWACRRIGVVQFPRSELTRDQADAEFRSRGVQAHHGGGAVGGLQNGSGVVQELAAHVGEGDAHGCPLQQLGAERVFQLTDRARDRRGGDAEFGTGLSEAAGVHHGHEVGQLT